MSEKNRAIKLPLAATKKRRPAERELKLEASLILAQMRRDMDGRDSLCHTEGFHTYHTDPHRMSDHVTSGTSRMEKIFQDE